MEVIVTDTADGLPATECSKGPGGVRSVLGPGGCGQALLRKSSRLHRLSSLNLVLALHIISFYLLSHLDVKRYYRKHQIPIQSS